ncbi:NAD(P)/FAD-dependent oxidoreductase [Virgibacillus ainsalahensis]
MQNQFDIIIVGGGIMAASLAYNLQKDGYNGNIAIFEKDKMYEYSSTPRSEGGVRQTFSTKVNIQMSQYSYQIYQTFEEDMAFDGDPCHIDFHKHGYLYLLNEKSLQNFEEIIQKQKGLGVKSKLMNQRETKAFFPELNVEDLAGAVFDPDAGNADPYSVLQGYLKHVRNSGASIIHEEVETILYESKKIKGIVTKEGTQYHAPIVVNAAGAWAGELSQKIGLEIPVKPLKRQLFTIDTKETFESNFPFTFDISGLHFRQEGSKVVVGWARDVPYGYDFKTDKSFFEDEIWPVLAERCPSFERIKIERGWSGLYDYNPIDHNAIISDHPAMEGYYIISGFSGHGFQHAPAAGKGLSELIRLGRFETIDLSPLSVERFAENKLVLETAVY